MIKSRFQILKMITVAGFIILLTVAAFIIPRAMYSLYDSRMLGKEKTLEVEVVPYEKEGEFLEQEISFSKCLYDEDGYHMSAVRVEEGNSSVDDEELNNIVNKELEIFATIEFYVNNGPLKVEQLNKRDLYSVYVQVPENEEGRDSITLWLLNYKLDGPDYSEIEILMDMEYHKIYDIWVYSETFKNLVEEYYNIYTYENNVKSKYKSYIVSDVSEGYDYEWEYFDNLRNYYGENQYFYIVNNGYNIVDGLISKDLEYYNNEKSKSEVYEGTSINYEDEGYLLPVIKAFGKNDRGGYMRIGIDGIRDILQL